MAGQPEGEAAVAEAIREAHSRREGIRIAGGGSKPGLGGPVEAGPRLDVSALSGVTLYEPAALTIVVKAGTKLAELQSVLASEGQHLPFEPPTFNHLYGSDGEATIGGTIACGLSGPRRIQAGAARDSLIGVRFVTGTGEIVKNGGRVMKNVTGYDLVKLMCGSHGTLGVLTEFSFKLLPRPETVAMLRLTGLDDAEAVRAMAAALTSPYDVTGAAHSPRGADGGPVTVIRVEGLERSVAYRAEKLKDMLAEFAPADIESSARAEGEFARIREVEALAEKPGAVWRLSVKPSDAPALVAGLSEKLETETLYDWGGGLIWLSTPEGGDCGAAAIRGAVARTGGHATLMRAGEDNRRRLGVFQPEPAAIAGISARLRAQFDPAGILNPGRMAPGARENAA